MPDPGMGALQDPGADGAEYISVCVPAFLLTPFTGTDNRSAVVVIRLAGQVAGFAVLIAGPGYLLPGNVAVLCLQPRTAGSAAGCSAWPKGTHAAWA